MQFRTIVIKQLNLTDAKKEQMLSLHQQYYDNVEQEVFYKDLSQKDWVILLENPKAEVVGFSTVQLISLTIYGKVHLFVFSGDTVIREDARNPHGLTAGFIQMIFVLIKKHPKQPLYWFLISKGYRTYRFMPLYFKEFYPVYNQPTPKEKAGILNSIARYKFGELYDPERNVIVYPYEKDKLKPDHAIIQEARQSKNPHIRFFAERNPTFYKGDDLASIAQLNPNNFLPAIERIRTATVNEIDVSSMY